MHIPSRSYVLPLILLMPLAFANASQPQWKRIGETSTFTVYEDTSSVKVASTNVRPYVVEMLFMVDFKPGQLMAGPGVASLDGRSQFDCATHEVRDLSGNLYKEHMATGQIVDSPNTNPNWVSVKGQPLAELAWTAACGISP